ncbi:hypothetical protein CVT24_011144 [Panaeolus cyanescens]|uniref:Uncharacterized protein n=1 Tax=Panaeolus cyanescens TaxID=181874 RepID=A0A409YG77_9AGAR|nr:hypothetical protein CVT24_011144 [Panaeolus cyanescens]
MLKGLCQGEAVFPALKTVDLGIETLALWTLPILFEQLPSLECFVGHGYSMPYIDLAECLDPVVHHLTTLELGWPFSGSGLHDKAQQQESPLVQAFNLLECLCLPALETFRLSIQVNPCIHDLVDNVKVYKTLAAVINTYRGIIGLDAFPALKFAEFNLEMKVRVKHDPQNLYTSNRTQLQPFGESAMKVDSLSWIYTSLLIAASVPYSFAYEDQEIYNRDLDTQTHILQLRSHFISTMSTRELVEELEARVGAGSSPPPSSPVQGSFPATDLSAFANVPQGGDDSSNSSPAPGGGGGESAGSTNADHKGRKGRTNISRKGKARAKGQ